MKSTQGERVKLEIGITDYAARSERETIKLLTVGRVTGLPHVVELRFVSVGESFRVLAGKSESDWVKNLTRAGVARVRVGDLMYSVKPVIGTASEHKETLEMFRRKYGTRLVKRWYELSELCIKLITFAPPERRDDLKGEIGAKSDFGDWVASHGSYYFEVSRAFDIASEEYDFTIGRNFINTWIRERSIAKILERVEENDVIVEVGCGTGSEALRIAPKVRSIIATDISGKMVDLVRRKSKAKKFDDRIMVLNLAANQIDRVAPFLPHGKTRLVYSLNGALNCEPKLDDFVRGLSSIVEHGGHFICSVRNTLCLSEVISHALAFQFGRTNPRKKQPIMVSVGGRDIPSTYYQPSDFISRFSSTFALEELVALPCMLPPAYLNSFYVRLGKLASFIRIVDTLVSNKPLFNRLGDQTLFVFRRL